METMQTEPRPIVKLVGEDGNAFAILGRVLKAMRKAGCSQVHIDAFKSEATSAGYGNLLVTAMKYVEVR
jgi:hypothetical protein